MCVDQSSRHVGFASEPGYSRRPRPDEEYVMKHFNKHAKVCPYCSNPYSTDISGGWLCGQGHKLAQDVARYVYSKGGRAYSMLDRESLRQRVRVEIPPNCDKVCGLLQAVEHGLRVESGGRLKSHDKNYCVPSRPEKRRYHDDHYRGPVKESRRHRDEEPRYREERKYRVPRDQHKEKHRYSEKRRSMPTNRSSYGDLWEKEPLERHRTQSYYDGNPVYYYRPSKSGLERRIPPSESPKQESIRRTAPESYHSHKYGYPSSHRSSRYSYPKASRSSRYASPESYCSSGYSSLDGYRSSRYVSPDSHQSSGPSSPDRYWSRRSSWSLKRFCRDLFH
jgi:hypothetical protein